VGDGAEARRVIGNRPALVSICVPTRDRADFLKESIGSITAQTYAPLEILISDNASSDGTEALCRELAARDPRVRYVRHPRDIGLYQNHNFCIDESRGDYLCFFHDDDRHAPTILDEYAAVLDAHPSAGVVCADWDLIDERGQWIGARRFGVDPLTPGLAYIERTIATGRSSVCCPGALIRRAALGALRFPESGPIGFGDFLVWFEMSERHDVAHVGRTLWSYRQHARSLSRRPVHAVADEYLASLETYFAGHLARWPGHAARVERWRALAARYAFWALIYELCLHARRERGVPPAARVRSIFELADYHLSADDLGRARATLRRLRRGALQATVLGVVERMLDAGLTAPLAWATRHTERVRERLVAP
jgi:glycosyltransferase involved in cell wall biosynthesis